MKSKQKLNMKPTDKEEFCLRGDCGKCSRCLELQYLSWFRINADFGPADGDVKYTMNGQYEDETGKKVPKGWLEE